jgi:hypothetical protein
MRQAEELLRRTRPGVRLKPVQRHWLAAALARPAGLPLKNAPMRIESPEPSRVVLVGRPGPADRLSTLLRNLLVQDHGLNAIGERLADVVIGPDETGFDLTEFVRAKKLAAIGAAAALEENPN